MTLGLALDLSHTLLQFTPSLVPLMTCIPLTRYDLVDVAREWLSMSPCIDAYHAIDKSPAVTAADLTKQVEGFMAVNADVDAMMATDEGFLLGKWLKSSRAVSDCNLSHNPRCL